ncbi:flavin reductase family protein [Streptomyces sp. NPDC058848]|uniref:flavin reductase family protein n=1 Tax=unclassified Streptomyces TaxID=2593676 RepID=UPI0036C794AC
MPDRTDTPHTGGTPGTAPPPVDMRPLMAGFPTGVSIVTATAPDGQPWGMTCTSLCSVSLDPPTLLVCLRRGSPTLDAITAGGAFALNLLHDAARQTAELFASGDADRFRRVVWQDGADQAGPHLTEAAHSIADCAVVDASDVGTHTVVMGRVQRVRRLRPQEPLLYGMRRFASWTEVAEDGHLFYDFIS